MEDAPLIQTFRTLNKNERRELQKWVNSPFVNQRSDVVRLFEYLNEHVPVGAKEATEKVLDKKKVFLEVFPADNKKSARPFADADMRYVMSFLYQAVKQYLAYAHWSEDAGDTGRHLCKSLRQRGLEQVFEKEYAALSGRLAKMPQQSVDFFFQQYHLHLERWEIFRRSNRGSSEALTEAAASWDAYVACETLRQVCAMLSSPGQTPDNSASVYLDATLAALKAGTFGNKPAVQAYFHCYCILSEKDIAVAEQHFSWLDNTLRDHGSLFPDHELRDLYVVAINFCIRRLNSGAREYIPRALDLYRAGLASGILLEDGFLNKYTYNNILLLALGQEEWDWALQFLEQYKSALPPRDRDSAWRYNLATYYFRKKDYPKAQEILRAVEFRDVFYNLDARRMLVRIYYKLGETAALESLLDSFSVYLQRKRSALGYHRELNIHFVRFVKRLLYLEPGDATARERLRSKIQAAPYVAEREWLLGELGV